MVGLIAGARGRSGFGWCIMSLIISPLFAVIILALLPSRKLGFDVPTRDTHDQCPECSEWVLKNARKCKHCGTGLRVEIIS